MTYSKPISGSPKNTKGRGSNSKRQQGRDGLYPARMFARSRLVATFAGEPRLQLRLNVENPSLNLTFGCRAGKTGYGTAENSCQVPRPINFLEKSNGGHVRKDVAPQTTSPGSLREPGDNLRGRPLDLVLVDRRHQGSQVPLRWTRQPPANSRSHSRT